MNNYHAADHSSKLSKATGVMQVLGIETSGQKCSVSLLKKGELLGQISLMEQNRPQTNKLVSAVKELADRSGVELYQLDLVAVNRGPGSFTGLRVGLVFAKTLAYVHKLPLKGVETFAATLERKPESSAQIELVEDLRQGYVASQSFLHQAGHWKPTGELLAEEFSAWAERPRDGVFLGGGGVERLRKQMPDKQFPSSWKLLPAEEHFPDAVDIALLAARTVQESGTDDPFELKPLYIRRSAAEERLESQS